MEPNKSTKTSEVSSPSVYWEAPTSNVLTLKYIAIGALILILGFAGGIYFSRNLSEAQISQCIKTTPLLSQTISPTTIVSPQVISPSEKSDETATWKTYSNEKLGFKIQYPPNIFLKEFDPGFGMALHFKPYPSIPTQGDYMDSIRIQSDDHASFLFNLLYNAADNQTDIDTHEACGLSVTKLKNRKFHNYDAVEFISDGSNPPTDCGRDLIGYEHNILIQMSDTHFIKITNGSMMPEVTIKNDKIFDQILSTFEFINK